VRAFSEDLVLPSGVRGPVDLRALARLAASCFFGDAHTPALWNGRAGVLFFIYVFFVDFSGNRV